MNTNGNNNSKPPKIDGPLNLHRHGFRHNRWKGSGGRKWHFWHRFGLHTRREENFEEGSRQVCLSDLAVGEGAIVLDFHSWSMVKKRLASLGFTPGVQVSMIQNYGWGPLIVSVRGTRVALGRGEAAKIIVERGTHE